MNPDEHPVSGSARLLRTLALLALVAGAVASEVLTYRAGSRNPSLLLMLLFAGWVLSPFAALALARRKTAGWPASDHAIPPGLTLLFSVASPLLYAHPPSRQPASVFMLVPLVSWGLIGIAFLLAKRR